jgi:adenosine kinase
VSVCIFKLIKTNIQQGTDENSKILRRSAEGNGVKVAYVEDATTPTGTCAALVTGKHRTLVANIAAANNFKEEHLKETVCR